MTTRSLWAATSPVEAFRQHRLEGDLHADVAIVGGGYCGLSTALHLAESGRSVILLEAEDIGHGASGRNGGQVNPGLRLAEPQIVDRVGTRGKGLFRLGDEATDFLAELIRRKNLQCNFTRPGVIRLAHTETAMRRFEAFHRACSDRGVETRLLARNAVETLVGTRRYIGGLLDPRGGSVHPLALVRELARVAQEAGARLFTKSPALSLSAVGDRWKVATPHGSVTAPHVVVATNAYTEGLVPSLARSLLPVNNFQIATEPISQEQADSILPGGQTVYDSRRLILYFR